MCIPANVNPCKHLYHSGPLRSGPLRPLVVALAANAQNSLSLTGPSSLMAASNAGGVGMASSGAAAGSGATALTPRQLYTLNRILEALEYGSGQDFKM